jgi:hypothetical protein
MSCTPKLARNFLLAFGAIGAIAAIGTAAWSPTADAASPTCEVIEFKRGNTVEFTAELCQRFSDTTHAYHATVQWRSLKSEDVRLRYTTTCAGETRSGSKTLRAGETAGAASVGTCPSPWQTVDIVSAQAK